jgi:heme A synthase
MADTSQNLSQTKQVARKTTRKSLKPGLGTIIFQSIPYIIFGAGLGLMIYNPIFSLVDLIRIVFVEGRGSLNGAGGEQLPFYFQPSNIGLVIAILVIAVVLYFKWEVARNEKKFMTALLAFWILMNLLVLGVWQVFAENPFSLAWVEWQAPPALISALTFGMFLPKIRRAASGTMTAGGGSFDEVTISDDHHDHDDDN